MINLVKKQQERQSVFLDKNITKHVSDLAEHLRVSENAIEELEFESSNGSEGEDSSVEELLYKSGEKNEENPMKPASNDN